MMRTPRNMNVGPESDNDFLKVCDNGLFIILVLCLTLSIVPGIFEIHDVLVVGSTSASK